MAQSYMACTPKVVFWQAQLIVEEGRDEAIVLIGHTLWRIAQMAVALIILLALLQLFLFRAFLARRRRSDGVTRGS
jgi:hypothetical protein